MALASFGDIGKNEKRVRLFLRFYGNDFVAASKARIVKKLRDETRQ